MAANLATTTTTIATNTQTTSTIDPPGQAKNIGKERKSIRIGKSIDEYDLKRLPSVLRSKFSFYIEPSLKVSGAQTNSQKRLQQFRKQKIMEREKSLQNLQETNSIYSSSLLALSTKNKKLTLEETEKLMKQEKERHERLIGQLKAAEARNRIRILRMRYFNCKEDEIDHLIDSQPSALKAVRLEAFLPPVRSEKPKIQNQLNPIQRRRLEALIDDNSNSLIERKLH